MGEFNVKAIRSTLTPSMATIRSTLTPSMAQVHNDMFVIQKAEHNPQLLQHINSQEPHIQLTM